MTVPGILAAPIEQIVEALPRAVADAFDSLGNRLNGVVSLRPSGIAGLLGRCWRVSITPHRAARLGVARIRDGERVLVTFDFAGYFASNGQTIDLVVNVNYPPEQLVEEHW